MKRLRAHLTYANVVSTLCLFLVLGGGAAVAVSTVLPKNSVGTKQLKKGAVTPVKLSEASKATLTGPEGPRGPEGPPGQEGRRGPEGPQGDPGEVLFPPALPSGQTQKGAYGIASTRANKEGGAFYPGVQVSYPVPLSFTPTINVIEKDGPPTANCPGDVSNPTATAGNLCLYAQQEGVPLEVENIPASGRFGFMVFPEAEEGFNYQVTGTWAVTAP
ncbi:MAG: hypothetical protein M3Y75_01640 [Actinomycetota bacterium]|nr:hypothetical protein [Actinomycetota bacterium]